MGVHSARAVDVRRGVRLEVITVVWMLAEGVVAVAAGVAAGSALLTAFGLDSVIQLTSGSVLLWRLSGLALEHRARLRRPVDLDEPTVFELVDANSHEQVRLAPLTARARIRSPARGLWRYREQLELVARGLVEANVELRDVERMGCERRPGGSAAAAVASWGPARRRRARTRKPPSQRVHHRLDGRGE